MAELLVRRSGSRSLGSARLFRAGGRALGGGGLVASGISAGGGGGGGGAAALLTDEANGFAADFTWATDAKRVAVKETLGPELVTNGGFDSGTEWTPGTDWTISGGVASKVAGGAITTLIHTLGAALVSGRSYRLTYTLVWTAGSVQSLLTGGGNATGQNRSTTGTHTELISSIAAHSNLVFQGGTTFVGSIDNVSLKEVVAVGTTTTTEYGVDTFFSNAGTSPKQVYDAAGTLVWSPHNMCLRSQEFDQATPWNPTTAMTITANAIAAPDGTLTADRLVETAANNNHQLIHANITQIVGETYTFSIYAKAGERNWLALMPANVVPTDFFDLTNGVIGNTANGAVITAAGGGWYRCSITYVAPSSNGPNLFIRTANGQPGIYLGDITKGLYVWGAQLNRGSVPTAYLPTTTAARYGLALDYDPVTHAAKGLLCEPAGTNLALRSSEFDNASWSKTNATVTANAVAAPDGQVGGDAIIPTAGSVTVVLQQGVTTVAATTYTYSLYAKNGTLGNNWCELAFNSTSIWRVWFNLATGAKGSSVGSPTSYNITSVGNGWYRLDVTLVAGATSSVCYLHARSADGSTGAITGDGTSPAFYLWGAQLETGTVATSPIPTYAASATRAVDNYSCTVAQINHSATAGSMIAAGKVAVPSLSNYFVSLNDATTNELIGLRMAVNKTAFVIDGGAIQFAPAGTAGTTARTKLAMAWEANDFAFSADGAAAETDVVGTLPTVTRLSPGQLTVPTAPVNVESIVYVPRRMSNAELVTKTT